MRHLFLCLVSPAVHHLGTASPGRKDKDMAKPEVQLVERSTVPPLTLPPCTDPALEVEPHSYHSLSQCLRTNIFPGAWSTWVSESRHSYVRHPLSDWPPDPRFWYGHKTDDVVQWTEKNIIDQKLKKRLTEMERSLNTL